MYADTRVKAVGLVGFQANLDCVAILIFAGCSPDPKVVNRSVL